MGDELIKYLERDRKRAIKIYGENQVFQCLSEKTDYQTLCDMYGKFQGDIIAQKHIAEAKWLKDTIEKTIVAKVMEEHGYTANGNKLVKE